MPSPYAFAPDFERAVIGLMATSDRFFNLVGPHLDPARFDSPTARLIAAECRALYEHVGKAAGSAAVVLQRLRGQHEKGKLSASALATCSDYLCDALDAGLPDPDVAVHEVAAVLKRVGHQAALDDAFTVFAQRGDMAAVARNIEVVESIGRNDASYGASLEGFAEELDSLGLEDRLSTGFRDLDVEMGGGTARGEFWFWLAGPKVGKSMALVQNTVIGLLSGMHVAVATLELDAVKWRARVLGCLTGTPYQDILLHKSKSIAFARLQAMQEDPAFNIGRLSIHRFAGHQTKMPTIFDWVKREEDRHKAKAEVLVVDYNDKLLGRDEKASEYLQMRDVYESHRLWCVDAAAWGWSASQAKAIPLGEMPTINHCADSIHKVRVTDGMIGITCLPDDKYKVRAKVLAIRNGSGAGAEAGPLANGFDYGCFVYNCVLSTAEVEDALLKGEPDPATEIFG